MMAIRKFGSRGSASRPSSATNRWRRSKTSSCRSTCIIAIKSKRRPRRWAASTLPMRCGATAVSRSSRARGRAARRTRRGARHAQPAELALPRDLLAILPPRPSGYGNTRELFPRYTGQMFDAITPAVVASDMTLGFLLSDTRAARLVEQHALDAALPGLEAVIDRLICRSADVRRHEREPVRSRDRPRRAARRGRAPDDARLDGRHATGTGDCEPEAPATCATAVGNALDQRWRIRARGHAGVGHQAIPRSAVHAGEPHRCPDRASRCADRRSREWIGWDGWRRTAAGNRLRLSALAWALGFRLRAQGSGLRAQGSGKIFE